jgi:predicted CXXCH cytochrome family protein
MPNRPPKLVIPAGAKRSGWTCTVLILLFSFVMTIAAAQDTKCAACHQTIYNQYQQTTMARGSGAAIDGFIPGSLKHQPSGITYAITRKDNQVWLTYDRPNSLHGEQQLEYYIGSGHRGRTYLFQQDHLWFEAPINYYGKKQLWDMAPAYLKATSMPFTLAVDSNCLHCHASQVNESIDGVRNKYAAAPFLQGGIGCAACHGDASSHLAAETAHKGKGVIVNPDKLPPAARDSTCLQCHLEGDAAVYKPERSLATYKPGQDLSDSVVYFVNTSRPNFGNRASSQYEALLRSACKRASGDKLTCTSCHDPHSSPAPEQRVAFYRGKCLTCHIGEAIATRHHPEQQDCAACHMPTRDTSDISHEQLTDHDIERKPNSGSTLVLVDLGETPSRKSAELQPVGSNQSTDRELGLAYAQLARQNDRRSAERAIRLLTSAEEKGNDDEQIHAELGFLQQLAGNLGAASEEYQSALKLDPNDTVALGNLAVLDAATGHSQQAIELLGHVLMLDPAQTRAGMNLAFLQCSTGQQTQARSTLERISIFNPDDATLRKFMKTGEFGGQRCQLH